MNKLLNCEVKNFDNANDMIIEIIGTNENVDRDNDIVKVDGLDTSDYLKNPVVLQNHEYHSEVIGKCLEIRVENKQMIFKIQFANTEEGKKWYYLYANGFMKAASIGFIGTEYAPNTHGGLTFTKAKLLEISMVSIPANATALTLSKELKENIGEKMYNDLVSKAKEQEEKLELETLKILLLDAVKEIKEIKETLQMSSNDSTSAEEGTENEDMGQAGADNSDNATSSVESNENDEMTDEEKRKELFRDFIKLFKTEE